VNVTVTVVEPVSNRRHQLHGAGDNGLRSGLPRLSAKVSVPAVNANTCMPTRVRGPGEKVNVRDVPVLEPK